MNIFKKVLVGAATAAALTVAQAAPVTVGGVTWDPSYANDFTATSANMRQFINGTTGELTGFGVMTALNGDATFCSGGSCQLTLQFGGFMPTGGTTIPGIGQTITYNGGYVNVYVGPVRIANPFDYDTLTWANTQTSTLWLSFANNYNFLGSNINNSLLSGLGFLDVTGGLAAANFDTNSQDFGSDLAFTASFSNKHTPGDIKDMSGTGNFKGASMAVPEPATIALLGISLLGFTASRRRAKGAATGAVDALDTADTLDSDSAK